MVVGSAMGEHSGGHSGGGWGRGIVAGGGLRTD